MNEWMNEWGIYIALLLCIAIHPKRFTIMWGVNVLLSIATNIPVLLMTAFVLQGHICNIYIHEWSEWGPIETHTHFYTSWSSSAVSDDPWVCYMTSKTDLWPSEHY